MYINRLNFYLSALLLVFALPLLAQEDHAEEGEYATEEAHEEYDAVEEIMGHISDANEFHVWKDVHIPLPMILYAPEAEEPWSFFMSSKLEHGHTAVNGYVLNHGRVNRIADPAFPKGKVHIEAIVERGGDEEEEEIEEGEEVFYAVYEGKRYRLDEPSTLGGGILKGAGITSFYDFSITKNVFTLFFVSTILLLIFIAVARGYKRNEGKAPSGIQSFFEPFFIFIRDEVTRPMIGDRHYERFQPFIMTLFFFVLFLNLIGLVPIFPGSANVTGNLAVTLTLAVLTFIITNINGNAHYWKHTLWMPGIPAWVKPILTIVEVLGLFIKPFSLMIRLFANITAGHIIILSLIGLIFLFGDSGANPGGAGAGVLIGGLFTAFMNLIEIIVAFLQAFIFAILSASYIGAAVEDSHDHEHEHGPEEVHGGSALGNV